VHIRKWRFALKAFPPQNRLSFRIQQRVELELDVARVLAQPGFFWLPVDVFVRSDDYGAGTDDPFRLAAEPDQEDPVPLHNPPVRTTAPATNYRLTPGDSLCHIG
jgi:hypothetical protein